MKRTSTTIRVLLFSTPIARLHIKTKTFRLSRSLALGGLALSLSGALLPLAEAQEKAAAASKNPQPPPPPNYAPVQPVVTGIGIQNYTVPIDRPDVNMAVGITHTDGSAS